MRRILLLLLLSTTAAAGDLQKRIDAIQADVIFEAIYTGIDTAAYNATVRGIRESKKVDVIVKHVAHELAITEAAARPLVEAVLTDRDRKVAADVLFRQALREAPKSTEVKAAYIAFLLHHDADAALAVARTLAPADAARFSKMISDERRVILIADALRYEPANRALLEALTDLDSPAIRAAFIDPRWSTAAAAKKIAAYLELGRAKEALALSAANPEAIDLEYVSGQTVRSGLALAAVLDGQPPRAKQLDKKSSLVKALIAPPADAYDVLAGNAGASTGVWRMALEDLAHRSGYETFAQQVHARRPPVDQIAANALRYLPEHVGRVLQPAPSEGSGDGLENPSYIARLLRAPRIVPFREHVMPASLETTDVTPIDCHDAEKVAKSMKLPRGLWPLRLERHGDEVAGVAIAGTLDPVGELGLGGYWILHSSDRGKTWDAPLYTGLRENMPYVALPSSRLPLMTGGGVQVEVEVRELDMSSITFPPVGLRAKREAKNLYIEFAWDALRRDSDNDGLTDLVEERIVTDPRNADTDGDGIIDGKDGLPQVALIAAPTPEAEALRALFTGIRLGLGAIVSGLPSTQEQRQECVVRASHIGDATLFLVGDRQSFAPIDISRRVVVFTPDEHALYAEKFGPSYFGQIDYLLVRRDGKKAVVYLNEEWAGNEYELTKTKDGWDVKVIGGWIT